MVDFVRVAGTRREVRARIETPFADLVGPDPPLADSLRYYEQKIVPEIKRGHNVLVVAHGNSLRALVKHLEHVSDVEIVAELPNELSGKFLFSRSTVTPTFLARHGTAGS